MKRVLFVVFMLIASMMLCSCGGNKDVLPEQNLEKEVNDDILPEQNFDEEVNNDVLPEGNQGIGVVVTEAPKDFYQNPNEYIYICQESYSPETAFAPRDALLTTDADVKNFSFFSVNFDYEEMVYSISEIIYTDEVFSPDEKIVLGVDVGEVISFHGFSYEESDGTIKRFVIGESGEDGSLCIGEF